MIWVGLTACGRLGSLALDRGADPSDPYPDYGQPHEPQDTETNAICVLSKEPLSTNRPRIFGREADCGRWPPTSSDQRWSTVHDQITPFGAVSSLSFKCRRTAPND